jgi:hypothetical protein
VAAAALVAAADEAAVAADEAVADAVVATRR